MNQKTNIYENQEKKLSEERPKSSFIPSNYYYEKPNNNSSSNNSTSMPSQYYNFLPKAGIQNERKDSDPKTNQNETKPNNMNVIGFQQGQPFNITNNISISNYTINENQKKQIKFIEETEMAKEMQRQSQDENLQKESQKPNLYQNMQQPIYSFPIIKNEQNLQNLEINQVSKMSKNIKKFNRNQSIMSQNFGYLNQDGDDMDPNQEMKLHPQNFFKTKLCPHFFSGNCTRGNKCKFSHSEQELRRMPDLRKTKICQLYIMGRCHMGASCTFAHGKGELRANVDYYKTMLCKTFKNGFCPKGQFCTYAHGEDDLCAPKFYDNENVFKMKLSPNEEDTFNNEWNEGEESQPDENEEKK